ncbi:MAG: alpha/beta hydrolase [Betaproteobacteria bacterium]|nr:alpha/beta hydrolase [Betaproteobacteria bacterium]
MGPEIWDDVQGQLPSYRHQSVDLGFRGVPITPVVQMPVVITHSLGLMWALHNIPRPWASLVAINGFTRFTTTLGFPGVAQDVLARMTSRLSENPHDMVGAFLQRCGIESPLLSGLDVAMLLNGLESLSEWDTRPQFKLLDCPILAISGASDPIVSVRHSCACFPASMHIIVEGGGHLLPLTHASLIASHVAETCTKLWKI